MNKALSEDSKVQGEKIRALEERIRAVMSVLEGGGDVGGVVVGGE